MLCTNKLLNMLVFIRAITLMAATLGGIQLLAQIAPDRPRIAHAGGQIGNNTYTNSLDALDVNYESGFRIFEMDFSWTSDQLLVCLHDWEESFERSFNLPQTQPISLTEFEQLVQERSAYKKCTLSSLMEWFSSHPQAMLVTDVKERNLEALELISSNYPQFVSQIIPQIYQPDEYTTVRNMGYEKIIWTLYLYPGGSTAVLERARSMELWAITMDTTRAEQKLGLDLDSLAIPSYVHTINNYADYLYFKSVGIDEIYTDSLSLGSEKRLETADQIKITDSKIYQAQERKILELSQSVSQFFEKPMLHYSIANDFAEVEVSSNQISDLSSEDGGLRFTATGNDPYLSLPTLSNPRNELDVYVLFDSPDSSRLELFYATQSQPNFNAVRRMSEITARGRNELVIHLGDSSPITRIRIDPGTVPGEYNIERLEIRSN